MVGVAFGSRHAALISAGHVQAELHMHSAMPYLGPINVQAEPEAAVA